MDAEYIKSSSKHADSVSMVSELWSSSPFDPNPVHVYGHQDTSNRTLNRLEKLNRKINIKAKSIAIQKIMEENAQPIIPMPLCIGTVICWGMGVEITSRVQHTL